MWEKLNAFQALLLTADPTASHYFGTGEGSYTVWAEYELDGLHGGNVYAETKWRVLVERYTTTENDPIVIAIMNKLAAAENVTFEYSVRRNQDLKITYHAWNCEVC